MDDVMENLFVFVLFNMARGFENVKKKMSKCGKRHTCSSPDNMYQQITDKLYMDRVQIKFKISMLNTLKKWILCCSASVQ